MILLYVKQRVLMTPAGVESCTNMSIPESIVSLRYLNFSYVVQLVKHV